MHIYWTKLILFTFLGTLILGVFLYGFVWDQWKRYKRMKEFERRSPKKAKKNKDNAVKDPWYQTLTSIVFGIPFVLGLFVLLPSFCLYIAYPHWIDLPRVITGNYEEISGTLTDIYESSSGDRSWGYDYYISIDGVTYESTVEINKSIGEKVLVEVLPNTEVIVNVKD